MTIINNYNESYTLKDLPIQNWKKSVENFMKSLRKSCEIERNDILVNNTRRIKIKIN